jgi:hypothetical protein
MKEIKQPVLSFTCNFDERTAWEVELKGWFEGALVTLPSGHKIPLSFWDPARLNQEVQADFELGKICFSEPALIVVPKVTRENMERAAQQLFDEGYFERLIAVGQTS